ncbi:MAG: thioredoxin domain-containing protein, partial [Halobaculum sp.]
MRPTEGSIHTRGRDRGSSSPEECSDTDTQVTPRQTAKGRVTTGRETTRRAMLASVSAGVVGLAGCAGEESVNCPSPETETPVKSMPPMAVAGSTPTVAVHAWEDLSCPHCATFATEVVPRLREEYVSDGVVRFVRHD